MIDISFEINGRRVRPSDIENALEKTMLESVAEGLRESLASVRDPTTGEFPTVVVRGRSLDNLSVEVEGSDVVIALAKDRLAKESDVAENRP